MSDSGIAWKEEGEGRPLVLIHGTGGSRDTWAAVFDRLAAQRRALAIDLPGFGESRPLEDTPPTVEALTGAVAEWIRTEGLEGIAVAGNSLGGAIALELAKLGAVSSAVALSPIGFWRGWEVRYSAAALRGLRIGAKATAPIAPGLLATGLGRTACLWLGMGRPWRLTRAEALAGGRALASAPSFAAVLGAARDYRFDPVGLPDRVPVSICWGRRDRILFPRQGRRAAEVLPGVAFTWLPGCGHVPISDDPALVADLILAPGEERFLSDLRQGPRGGR